MAPSCSTLLVGGASCWLAWLFPPGQTQVESGNPSMAFELLAGGLSKAADLGALHLRLPEQLDSTSPHSLCLSVQLLPVGMASLQPEGAHLTAPTDPPALFFRQHSWGRGGGVGAWPAGEGLVAARCLCGPSGHSPSPYTSQTELTCGPPASLLGRGRAGLIAAFRVLTVHPRTGNWARGRRGEGLKCQHTAMRGLAPGECPVV